MALPPNLLFLPGLVCDARLWHHQVSGLADVTHSRVADLAGGESIQALASSALAQAPAGPLAIAGLSMGGYVALEIMRQAPGRVRALALLDTSARPDPPEGVEARRSLIEKAESHYDAVVDELIPKLVHPDHLADAGQVGLIKAMAHAMGKEVFRRQQRAMMERMDSRPGLKDIQCSTLVLCGRQDAITSVEVHEEMAAGIQGANLVILEDCGHLSPLGQPRAVTDALRAWLMSAGN